MGTDEYMVKEACVCMLVDYWNFNVKQGCPNYGPRARLTLGPTALDPFFIGPEQILQILHT